MRSFALGALTPLLPCATLAGVLALVLLSGSGRSGALAMAAFALGTVPLLLVGQWGMGALRSVLSPRREQWAQRGLLAVSTLLVLTRAVILATGGACH